MKNGILSPSEVVKWFNYLSETKKRAQRVRLLGWSLVALVTLLLMVGVCALVSRSGKAPAKASRQYQASAWEANPAAEREKPKLLEQDVEPRQKGVQLPKEEPEQPLQLLRQKAEKEMTRIQGVLAEHHDNLMYTVVVWQTKAVKAVGPPPASENTLVKGNRQKLEEFERELAKTKKVTAGDRKKLAKIIKTAYELNRKLNSNFLGVRKLEQHKLTSAPVALKKADFPKKLAWLQGETDLAYARYLQLGKEVDAVVNTALTLNEKLKDIEGGLKGESVRDETYGVRVDRQERGASWSAHKGALNLYNSQCEHYWGEFKKHLSPSERLVVMPNYKNGLSYKKMLEFEPLARKIVGAKNQKEFSEAYQAFVKASKPKDGAKFDEMWTWVGLMHLTVRQGLENGYWVPVPTIPGLEVRYEKDEQLLHARLAKDVWAGGGDIVVAKTEFPRYFHMMNLGKGETLSFGGAYFQHRLVEKEFDVPTDRNFADIKGKKLLVIMGTLPDGKVKEQSFLPVDKKK